MFETLFFALVALMVLVLILLYLGVIGGYLRPFPATRQSSLSMVALLSVVAGLLLRGAIR